MQALIIIDAQNEFSEKGKRPVVNLLAAVEVIRQRVEQARLNSTPIVWIRHHNKPDESPAFVPGTWGAEFLPGFGPQTNSENEVEFQKNVYGAFTGTPIHSWLKKMDAGEILITGFYTHGCVSTTAREAIMAGLIVYIDPNATGTCDISHDLLGQMTADEIRRSALLQLANMGAIITLL